MGRKEKGTRPNIHPTASSGAGARGVFGKVGSEEGKCERAGA